MSGREKIKHHDASAEDTRCRRPVQIRTESHGIAIAMIVCVDVTKRSGSCRDCEGEMMMTMMMTY